MQYFMWYCFVRATVCLRIYKSTFVPKNAGITLVS